MHPKMHSVFDTFLAPACVTSASEIAVMGGWAPLSCLDFHYWLSISCHNSQRLNFFNFLLYIQTILGSYTMICTLFWGRNHYFLIAMKSVCANHLQEIATLVSVSSLTHGNSVGLISMCIPLLPVIKMPSLSKEPGTIE